jgi:low affinity Fe/Cu permease
MLAILVILTWAVTGPVFGFSDTWQLAINTGTTIVTFLMVFLIQNTQNRESRAMQLKLDELIRASRARDSFIDIEDLSDEELTAIAARFHKGHENLDNPGLSKFQARLEEVMTKRRNLPGEEVANQVVSIFNPFGRHDDQTKHKK